MASKSRVLYTGVTGDLPRRVEEHKEGIHTNSFTIRYRVTRLVYYEEYRNVYDAIDREKEIKGWRREKKVALVNAYNPQWLDLSEDYIR